MDINTSNGDSRNSYALQRYLFNELFGKISLADWDRYLKQFRYPPKVVSDEEVIEAYNYDEDPKSWFFFTMFNNKDIHRLNDLSEELSHYRKKWVERNDHKMSSMEWFIEAITTGREDILNLLKYTGKEYRKWVIKQLDNFDVPKMRELLAEQINKQNMHDDN